MDWEQLRDTVYYLDGFWRDIYVMETNISDWQKWVDYVNEKHQITWYNNKTKTNENKINFSVIEDYFNKSLELRYPATIYINNISLDTYFFTEEELESSFDPSQLNSIDDHNSLLSYMKDISKQLNKKIILTPENLPEYALISVDKDIVTISKDFT